MELVVDVSAGCPLRLTAGTITTQQPICVAQPLEPAAGAPFIFTIYAARNNVKLLGAGAYAEVMLESMGPTRLCTRTAEVNYEQMKKTVRGTLTGGSSNVSSFDSSHTMFFSWPGVGQIEVRPSQHRAFSARNSGRDVVTFGYVPRLHGFEARVTGSVLTNLVRRPVP